MRSSAASAGHGGAAESILTPHRIALPFAMVTVASIEAMIRECSMYEEHLSAQLADAERDAPDSVTGLIVLLDVVRELKAELIAAHPTRLRDRSSRTRRGP
jgi:hypothetical protein